MIRMKWERERETGWERIQGLNLVSEKEKIILEN